MKINSGQRALIIAAGRGERLNIHSKNIPKCLIPINGEPIITRILRTLALGGIRECVLVTGYKAEILKGTLGDLTPEGLRLSYVHNEEWHKKNGVSVLAARGSFSENESFLLMMSDHLFFAEILQCMERFQLEEGQVGLAVDERIDSVFDIDDATKVQVVGSEIMNIGKNITGYNAVDCGLFKCTPAIFESLEREKTRNGDCSLTDGCLQLARNRKLLAIPTENSVWLDVDTPESLRQAELIFPSSRS